MRAKLEASGLTPSAGTCWIQGARVAGFPARVDRLGMAGYASTPLAPTFVYTQTRCAANLRSCLCRLHLSVLPAPARSASTAPRPSAVKGTPAAGTPLQSRSLFQVGGWAFERGGGVLGGGR